MGYVRLNEASPSTFLKDKVLTTDIVRQRLQMWLSVARSNYLFKQFLRRRPKVWMLTALYELEGVSTYALSEKGFSASAKLSSALAGIVSTVPVGGSLSAGAQRGIVTEGFVPQPMVYAARWQLLKSNYVERGREHDPLTIELHPDNIYSIGYVMGDDEEEENEAEDADFAVLECAAAKSEDFEDSGRLTEDYWAAFQTAERMMEKTVALV